MTPEVSGWLSLKISNKPGPESQPQKASLLVSIPKKTVRLATRRNRLKRLIREAFRNEALVRREKIYEFRVLQNPGDPGFDETKEMVKNLIQNPGENAPG